MFTVSARLRGDAARRLLSWDAGRLAGDPALVELVAREAARREGRRVGPEPNGPYTMRRHLASGISTLALIRDLVEPDALVSGDAPLVAASVEGAIA